MKKPRLTEGCLAGYVPIVGLAALVSILCIAGCTRDHNPLASQDSDDRQSNAYVDIFVGKCNLVGPSWNVSDIGDCDVDAWIKVDTVTDPNDGTLKIRVTVMGVFSDDPNWNPDPGAPGTPTWPEWAKRYRRTVQLKQDSLWQSEDTCDTNLNTVKGYNPYRTSMHGTLTPTQITGEEDVYLLRSDGAETHRKHIVFHGDFKRMLVRDLPLHSMPTWSDDEEVRAPFDSTEVSSTGPWCVASNSHMLVAAGSRIVTSTDGMTWIARAATDQPIQGAIWTGEQFVAVGRGGMILTSPDGLTWTSRWNNMGGDFYGVAYGGGRYVVIGGWRADQSSQVVTSEDGVTWQSEMIDVPLLSHVTWTGSCFLASSSGGPSAAVSPDGVQWTAIDLGYAFSDILLDSSQIVGVRYTSERTEFYQASSLGDWNLVSTLDTTCIFNIAFDGMTYVAAGAGRINQWGAKIFVSTDLKNWTLKVSKEGLGFLDVIWTGSQFVAVGSAVATSSDGQTWDVRNL